MPLFSSSGDLVADRRYNQAMGYAEAGDPEAAIELLDQALELAPDWPAALFALGDLKERIGDTTGAATAFAKVLAGDPDDRHGARARLARLGAAPATGAIGAGYVRALFDDYASTFDDRLVGALHYRAPALMRAAVTAHLDVRGTARRFRRALDLGCGTGLAGAAFRDMVGHLAGVDLSPRMVAIARGKSLYDELAVGPLEERLAAAPPGSLDLVIAADVFVYLGDLAPVLALCARAVAPGGLVVFTVETHAGQGVVLGHGLRYAHAEAHVRAAAGALRVAALAEVSTRDEGGLPVPGLLAVLERPIDPAARND